MKDLLGPRLCRRILALVVLYRRKVASRNPRNTTGQVRGLSRIAGPTPEAAEFVRSSRAMYMASGLFRVIVRGLFASRSQPAMPGAA
ncbi:hypothetical protein MUU53_13320 [Rhizobium lemnae]|uniref:Uncharacterized protein n=1 Tax=Rhizobium lemnae TaxID=1214924 RepID=A0ABV8EGQ6_9HYPH|nr:hypothetical protein [Rhizobium lemnae]MCJ8508890.1 hypothetical protein [Rhizobium lemnae]